MLNLNPVTRREWRLGWPSVCAGLFGAAASQIQFATMGVFLKPIAQSTGWSNSTITFGIFICAVISVPGSPFAGWLAQRYGLTRIILPGLPLFLLAFAGLGLFSHSQAQWIFGWSLLAVVGVLVKSNLWMLWVAQKFDAARGMAFALVMAGSGVLAIFVPILTQLSVENFGWRATFPILAGVLGLIAITACVLGLRACPPTPGTKQVSFDEGAAMPKGLSIQQAARMRAFWMIALIAFLIGVGLASMQVHLVPMFGEKGLDARTAAVLAGLFGAAALAGRIVGGALLDRYSAKVIGMISLLLPALACVIYYLLPISPVAGGLIAILFGVGVGAEGDVLGYITAKFFGVHSFGAIFGIVSGVFSLGAGAGPWFMALLLDKFGSYAVVVPILFVALLVCAGLFLALGDYPDFDGESSAARPHRPGHSGPLPVEQAG
ncbi:MFS transporter [Novosphingobium sp. G106]|uniref:MFS transporter n=1 Tax=Novosphingobium sp. G106 TaxID=2849500 RepID=UPI001C2DCC82|nr:MFS transporter [Novosphingobium sp. G106]MBV1691534.1 MFS transporter [Novosphingobium sp. G106]